MILEPDEYRSNKCGSPRVSKGDSLNPEKRQMLDDYGFEIYEENAFPIAYLLTFRTFGTWLHGDERGALQRSRDPRFKTITFRQTCHCGKRWFPKCGKSR